MRSQIRSKSQERTAKVLLQVKIPGGRVADITIMDGRVHHVGSADRSLPSLDCSKYTVLPAGVDMHVHMRDWTQESKETWETGTKCALAGGVTVVVDQPNTIPSLTTKETLQERVLLAKSQSLCRFGVNGGVTPDSDIPGMWRAGALAFGETFAGPSSYGEAITHDLLERSMGEVAGLLGLMTIHAEEVHPGDDTTLLDHDTLRPISGERDAVETVIALNKSRCHLHFCHLSSEQAIHAAAGSGATIEVTPHHLFLSRDGFEDADPFGKVNPPLRTEEERRRLFTCWNSIDVIASDHAPHTIADKSEPFGKAPSGIPGLETMIPLLMGWVHEKRITLTDLIEKTVTKPAQVLGIRPSGYTPGSRGDFALYPENLDEVNISLLHSRAGWSPYEGMKAVFPEITILGGEIVYRSGEFFRSGNTQQSQEEYWIPGRGYTYGEPI